MPGLLSGTAVVASVAVAALVAAGLGALHVRDEAALAAARATFDRARQLEQQRRDDPTAALALYEQAIEQRGGPRLPWSNWRVATHAHANAATLQVRLGDAAGAREHAAAALADEPDSYSALAAMADSWAQTGHYYHEALPYLARLDRLAGRPAAYVDSAGRPTFPPASNQASLLPEAWEGPAPLRRFDGWLRENGAKISPKMRLSADVHRDGSGLRGVVATEAVHHREVLLQVPLRCTLTGLSPDHSAAAAAGTPHRNAPPHRLTNLFEAEQGPLVAALQPSKTQVKRGRPEAANLRLTLRLLAELGDSDSFYAPCQRPRYPHSPPPTHPAAQPQLFSCLSRPRADDG